MLIGRMYYPQEPKEPNGCLQALIISRMIMQILAIPLAMIMGAILAVILALWALTISPLLGLAVIAGFVLLLVFGAKWEGDRISRNAPKDD